MSVEASSREAVPLESRLARDFSFLGFFLREANILDLSTGSIGRAFSTILDHYHRNIAPPQLTKGNGLSVASGNHFDKLLNRIDVEDEEVMAVARNDILLMRDGCQGARWTFPEGFGKLSVGTRNIWQ